MEAGLELFWFSSSMGCKVLMKKQVKDSATYYRQQTLTLLNRVGQSFSDLYRYLVVCSATGFVFW
jgi:hypothetical protein